MPSQSPPNQILVLNSATGQEQQIPFQGSMKVVVVRRNGTKRTLCVGADFSDKDFKRVVQERRLADAE